MTTTTVATERKEHRFRLPGLQTASALYLLGFIIILFGLWIPETFLTQTTFKLVLADQVVIAILGLALLDPAGGRGVRPVGRARCSPSHWSSSAGSSPRPA